MPGGPFCDGIMVDGMDDDDLISAAGWRFRVGTGPWEPEAAAAATEPLRGGLDGAENELRGG